MCRAPTCCAGIPYWPTRFQHLAVAEKTTGRLSSTGGSRRPTWNPTSTDTSSTPRDESINRKPFLVSLSLFPFDVDILNDQRLESSAKRTAPQHDRINLVPAVGFVSILTFLWCLQRLDWLACLAQLNTHEHTHTSSFTKSTVVCVSQKIPSSSIHHRAKRFQKDGRQHFKRSILSLGDTIL